MKVFLQKYSQEFQSSSGKTPEWKSFYRTACSTFRKGIAPFGRDLQMSRGHFYFSGFFTVNSTGQIYYFSIGDVRWDKGKLLIRTAKDYKDYSGGRNQYVNIDDNLFESIQRLTGAADGELSRSQQRMG